MGAIEIVSDRRERMTPKDTKRCTETSHDNRAHWQNVSSSGCPVVGISICSFCRKPATMKDHLDWRKTHSAWKSKAHVFP